MRPSVRPSVHAWVRACVRACVLGDFSFRVIAAFSVVIANVAVDSCAGATYHHKTDMHASETSFRATYIERELPRTFFKIFFFLLGNASDKLPHTDSYRP